MDTPGRFAGRVVLITGGASGIGRATAVRMAAEGAAVAVADVNAETGERTRRQIESAGGRALFIRADVTDAKQCQKMASETVKAFGGLRGDWGGAAFTTAKGGVVNLTRHMAVAHAKEDIRVNCICPGVIETPLVEKWLNTPGVRQAVTARHPVGRLGKAEEVAAAVAFLASDEASFITGAILPVDGGSLAMGR